MGATFAIKNTNGKAMTIILDCTGAQRGIRAFVDGAGDAARNLFRLERAQQTASQIGQEAQFAIAAD